MGYNGLRWVIMGYNGLLWVVEGLIGLGSCEGGKEEGKRWSRAEPEVAPLLRSFLVCDMTTENQSSSRLPMALRPASVQSVPADESQRHERGRRQCYRSGAAAAGKTPSPSPPPCFSWTKQLFLSTFFVGKTL